MKKPLVMGHPYFYWRRHLLPSFICMSLLIIPGMTTLLLKVTPTDEPQWIVVVSAIVQFSAWVWLWVTIYRGHQLVKSYKASKGFRCLVCWYEMLPFQNQCPECGTPWVRKVLKAPWIIKD